MTELKLAVYPELGAVFGYRGKAAYVGFFWSPFGDEFCFDDGFTRPTPPQLRRTAPIGYADSLPGAFWPGATTRASPQPWNPTTWVPANPRPATG